MLQLNFLAKKKSKLNIYHKKQKKFIVCITFLLDEKYRNEIICRFLRDYNGDEDKVCSLVNDLYGWREKYGINNVLEDPEFENVFL